MSTPSVGTYGTMYYVDDMGKAAAFYRDVVGLKARYESAEWTELDLGDGTALCLYFTKERRLVREGGILIFNTRGIREVVASLKAKGVEFLVDVHEVHPGAYSADFRDAQGNVVSIHENTRA